MAHFWCPLPTHPEVSSCDKIVGVNGMIARNLAHVFLFPTMIGPQGG